MFLYSGHMVGFGFSFPQVHLILISSRRSNFSLLGGIKSLNFFILIMIIHTTVHPFLVQQLDMINENVNFQYFCNMEHDFFSETQVS